MHGTKSDTKRSFDRTFVIGLAAGGVVIRSDLLTLRAWGGSDAWKPEVDELSPVDRPTGLSDAQYDALRLLMSKTGIAEAANQVY